MRKMRGKLYLGLSGYAYKPWQGEGRFYPPELKAKEFFGFYASHFPSVEMDGTWYRMPSEAAVGGWLAQADESFRYTFKVHRGITHLKRLKEGSVESLQFMVKRLEPLWKAGRVGCIYLQFPPNFRRTDSRLEDFLPHLPPGPAYACEFRHESWDTDEVEGILRAYNVAFAVSDTDDRKGVRRDTGSVVYSRMRREAYDDETLQSWADYYRGLMDAGKDCYVFFKHEDEGSPWLEADRLRAMVEGVS